MNRIADFLAMGGYGVYIWPAFAITAAIMIVLLWSTLRTLRVNQAALAALEAAKPQRRGGSKSRSGSKGKPKR